jgi:hypothetical protein
MIRPGLTRRPGHLGISIVGLESSFSVLQFMNMDCLNIRHKLKRTDCPAHNDIFMQVIPFWKV